MYNPNMKSNIITEVGPECNFERCYIIGNEVMLPICIVELFYLIRNQFEVNEIYSPGIYEHKRSLPNDGHLKLKFKTFNMRVDLI